MTETTEKLRQMYLVGMLHAFEGQLQDPRLQELSFEERFGLIVDQEWTKRQNSRQARPLKQARFRLKAVPEDIDLATSRGLDRNVILALSDASWVHRRQNLLLTGPTGAGKTFIACALGHAACRMGLSVRYSRISRLMADISLSKGDGSYPRLMTQLLKVRLLILDDWGLEPIADGQGRDLLDVIDDRIGRGSTLIASQLPLEHWHGVIKDPNLADAILDRLVHTAHKIALKGESMRKMLSP